MLEQAIKVAHCITCQGSHDLSPQPSRSLDLKSTRLRHSNQAMFSYMHAQAPKEATPKVSSQLDPVSTPKHLSNTILCG